MSAPAKAVVVRSVPVGAGLSLRYVVITRQITDAGTVTWWVRHVRPTERHDEWTTTHRTKRAAWAAADETIAMWWRR